jgi:hypothetical protein
MPYRAREAHRGHRRHAVPALLQQGLALVHRLLPDPNCQHRRRAGLPGHRRGSFLHGPRGRRPCPGRGARSAALPPLRAFCRRAAAAERTGSAVARGLRRARVKDSRLVGVRAQPAHAVRRRPDEGSARRAARAHAEPARRSLTHSVTASSLRHRLAEPQIHYRAVEPSGSVVGTKRKCRNVRVLPELGVDRLCHPPARRSRP